VTDAGTPDLLTQARDASQACHALRRYLDHPDRQPATQEDGERAYRELDNARRTAIRLAYESGLSAARIAAGADISLSEVHATLLEELAVR